MIHSGVFEAVYQGKSNSHYMYGRNYIISIKKEMFLKRFLKGRYSVSKWRGEGLTYYKDYLQLIKDWSMLTRDPNWDRNLKRLK